MKLDETISILDEVLDDQCDMCWYLGDSKEQKVKTVEPYGLNLCKPCFISLKAIEG